ncbi:MAG: hypothetical protein D4S01_11510 [Dehalococcoidia bacterium]|nr:MAG: hypothetical protein D4S01_11510 [Dehalococcoidia bacterium]
MKKQYYIMIHRNFYGCKSTRSLERNLYGHVMWLPYKAAKEYIEYLNEHPYYLSHNEAGRPIYKIVGTDSMLGISLANSEW